MRRPRVLRSIGGGEMTVRSDGGVLTLVHKDSGVSRGGGSLCVSSGDVASVVIRRRMTFARRRILKYRDGPIWVIGGGEECP